MTVEPWVSTDVQPWTPVDAEEPLRWALRAMSDAQPGLPEARDLTVAAKSVVMSALAKTVQQAYGVVGDR